MARRSRPWWRESRTMWFFTHDGRQYPTGITDPNDLPAAESAQERILSDIAARVAKQLARPPEGTSDGRSAKDAVSAFLAHARRKVEAGRLTPGTLRHYTHGLAHFARHFGDRPISDLTADDIESWGDHPGWSSSTRHGYLGTAQLLLRWCRITLAVKRPPKESRGADCVLSDEQFAAVLEDLRRFGPAVSGDLAELLRVLRQTGARPGEIAPLTVEAVDWEHAHTRLRKHKTRHVTGRDRVIHFNTAAMGVLTAQRERYGEGLLFRHRLGGAYNCNAIARRMTKVSRRLGFRAISYGAGRHSFATAALAAGIPDAVVAELLGHRGTNMLHHHYAHLSGQSRVLKDAAEKVSRRDAG